MTDREDPLAARPLRIRPPDHAHRYTLFLSSSDEVAELRDRVESLVARAFNPLLEEHSDAHIRLRRWEQEMPQKAASRARVNEIFVEWVRKSHLTLVLLRSHLGSGTKEELEAALEEALVQLSVIRFAADPRAPRPNPDAIAEFLKPHRDALLFAESGLPDSDEAWQALVKTLFGFALAVVDESRRTRDEYGELR